MRSLICALALLLMIGCAMPPARQADVAGTITQITDDRVLVEEHPERSSSGPGSGSKGWFRVTESTLIRAFDGRRLELRDLRPGDRVRAWYRDFYAASNPPDGEAEALERH